MKALYPQILAENFWKTEIKPFPLCVISHEIVELVSNILWIILGYDKLPLFNALRIKFYNGHANYGPELSNYFQMY